MTNNDNKLMKTHGITCAPRNVFHYKDFKYDRLEDAVRYAELDANRVAKSTIGVGPA